MPRYPIKTLGTRTEFSIWSDFSGVAPRGLS
jgi:hypothetical protein